ncbi:MAG TPA: lantibiotic dehydratase, partial [Polyangiaceae bacterium]
MNPRPPLRVQASGFFVLRTPLLPVEAFEATSAKLLAPAAWREEENLDALLEQDRAQAISALRARLADPIVREALFLASPSVHDALAAWMDDPASSRGHGALEVLLRYLTRMSTRPTPFGLFSGCSLGTLGAKTRLELGAKDSSRRHTRLDVHYLSGLCEGLRA